MSKRQVLMLIGFVLIVSFLVPGFPDSVKRLIAVVSGVLIIFVAYKSNPEVRIRRRDDMPFNESRRESSSVSSAPLGSNIADSEITQPDQINRI